jgi:hypothetical protein
MPMRDAVHGDTDLSPVSKHGWPMQTELPAVSVRKASVPVRAESDAAVATLWLALYLLILAATVFRPVLSGALQFAGLD